MKITHLNNSFITVEHEQEVLILDPWIGKANSGGWHSYPEFNLVELNTFLHKTKVKWVYISHLHDDHFNQDTLIKCNLINCEFIIKKFNNGILKKRLLALGVNIIHEIEPYTVSKFGFFELIIFPQLTSNSSGFKDEINYDLDTSIVIKVSNIVFFNQVDNPLSNSDLMNVVNFTNNNFGNIDIACIMSGAASEYPHLFIDIDKIKEKNRIVENSLNDLISWLNIIKPHFYFPAGGTYVIPGSLSVFNDMIAQPSFQQINSKISNSEIDCIPLFLEGGKSISINNDSQGNIQLSDHQQLFPVVDSKDDSFLLHINDLYDHQKLYIPSILELNNCLSIAQAKWTDKIVSSNININQLIIFKIYSHFNIVDLNLDTNNCISEFILNKINNFNSGHLIIHIHISAIYACLHRKLIWNGVLGSLCMFERRPNIHYPTDIFSLNFLTI